RRGAGLAGGAGWPRARHEARRGERLEVEQGPPPRRDPRHEATKVDRSPRRERRRDEVVQRELRGWAALPEARAHPWQGRFGVRDHRPALKAVNPRHSCKTAVHTRELWPSKCAKSRHRGVGAALAQRAPSEVNDRCVSSWVSPWVSPRAAPPSTRLRP